MLFKTVHGSHLYGLANAGSDMDYYVVVPTRRGAKKHYAKQSIVDGVDTMTVDFGTWMDFCNAGVPQALEAMFSPVPEVDHLTAFRSSYRVNTAAMVNTYRRTIFNFFEQDTLKMRRHALRLAVNLVTGVHYGRFNPRLPEGSKSLVLRVADQGQEFTEETLNILLELAQ